MTDPTPQPTLPDPLWFLAMGLVVAFGIGRARWRAIHGYVAANTRVVRDAIRSRRTGKMSEYTPNRLAEVEAERDAAHAAHQALTDAVRALIEDYEADDRDHLDSFGQHHPVAHAAARHLRAILDEHGSQP